MTFNYSFSSKDLIDFSSSNICTSIFWAAEEGVLNTPSSAAQNILLQILDELKSIKSLIKKDN